MKEARLQAIIEENGEGKHRLTFNSPQYFRYEIGKLPLGNVSVVITPKRSTRSGQQNNLYWIYLTIIADETGHTPDELHTYFKGKFLTEQVKEVLGEKTRMTKSTSELSKGEFVEYLLDIQALTDVPIPDTDEWFGMKGSYHK